MNHLREPGRRVCRPVTPHIREGESMAISDGVEDDGEQTTPVPVLAKSLRRRKSL